MSRSADRSNRAHLAAVPAKPRRPNCGAISSLLGKQAAIGGKPNALRALGSDRFAALFAAQDANGRLTAMEIVARTLAKAPEKPAPYVPSSRHDRVKIKWTDEMRARFLAAAASCQRDGVSRRNGREIARRMGLDEELYKGACKMAWSRWIKNARPETVAAPGKPQPHTSRRELPLAA